MNLLERISKGGVLVADGAMGTMLFRKGLSANQCPEKLNLTNPEILEQVAKEYLDSGADIIQTNSFGGSPLKLAMYTLDDQTEEINRSAINSVRSAIGKRAYLSFSCGPSGRLLKPYGDTEPDLLYESFQRQLKVAAENNVDLICIETMTDIEEAKLAIQAAQAVTDKIPIAATMTFDTTPNGFYTIMGVDIERAVRELTDVGIDIIGSNCGNGIENMVKIADQFRRLTMLPLLIQSNAGLPELIDGQPVYSESPQFMAEKAVRLCEFGVNIIGGCCGTTPEHIAAIRKVVNKYNRIRSKS